MPKGTANTKDYENLVGYAATYDYYNQHGTNYDYGGSGTVYSGQVFYNSSGSVQYRIKSPGAAGGTRREKVFLIAKNSTATQNFAFDMEE